MNNYVMGRAREIGRLTTLRSKGIAILGGRFRGSKISKGWLKSLQFNPFIDLWYIDNNGVIYFEQLKTAAKGHKATISQKEISGIQKFADIYYNYPNVWVGYVIKEYHKPERKVRLN